MSELSKEQCEEIAKRDRLNRFDYGYQWDASASISHCADDRHDLLDTVQARDAEITRLNALLAEAREGLEAVLEKDGWLPRTVAAKARATLAKLGA